MMVCKLPSSYTMAMSKIAQKMDLLGPQVEIIKVFNIILKILNFKFISKMDYYSLVFSRIKQP
jgi:hypothetical protein